MKFLNQLLQFCLNIFQDPDQLPSRVSPQERLSRYVVYNRHMKKAKNQVSPEAFVPSSKTNNTSVYRTNDCSEKKIWDIGDNFVTALLPDKKPVIGRADLPAHTIDDQQLRVVPETNPHPRHANIEGWPLDPDAVLMKARELAKQAHLIVRA